MNIQMMLKNKFYPPPKSGDGCAEVIRRELAKDAPSMIARFGSTEIKAVLYPRMPLVFRKIFMKRILGNMETLSGFFPSTPAMIDAFSHMMYQDMRQLDILGSWRIEERLLQKEFPRAARVELSTLEPYLWSNPWTQELEGKKVLVVHPFSVTIERQYHERRIRLFADQRVLPEFKSLETVKAVQTIAGNRQAEFPDWFSALRSMQSAMDAKDYDVVILGCGAYGFPLAAHAKRQGKKAIHLGGPTQVLFGIKGKRWEDHPVISKFFNEHWVRPAPEDTPKGSEKVEKGCYW